MFAHIARLEGDLALELLIGVFGNADGAGTRQRFHARRDIDAVAENVGAVDDHVADIDADAEFDAALFRDAGVALGHDALDVEGAARGVNGTSELGQHAIAGRLDDAAAMFGDFGIDDRFLRVLRPASVASSSSPISRL